MKFFEQWVDDNELLPVIKDFDDLLSEITYAYEELWGPIHVTKEGVYIIYKLAVGSNWAQYKEHIYRLNPGVYASMVKFFEIKYEVDNKKEDL